MKFKINVGNFKKGLFSATNIATKQVDKEISSAFLINIRVEKEAIVVTAFGGTAGIISIISNENIHELKYDCEEEGDITVRVTEFMNALDSFPDIQDVKIEKKSNKVIIDMVVGAKEGYQRQIITLTQDKVKLPKIAKKFNKQIDVHRDILAQGLSKVAFAMGWEDTNPKYECLLLDVKKDMIRLASSTGGRFAVDDITGNGVLDGIEETSFIFPKNNISNIINILKGMTNEDAEKVTIKQSSASADNPEQIIIETDKKQHMLCLFGIDTAIKYKDMNIFINNKYPYAMNSNLEDWVYAANGIYATYSDEMKQENDILNAQVTVNFNKERFEIESKHRLSSERTVPFKTSKNNGENKSPVFRCNINYLTELVSRHFKSGEILMEIDEEKSGGKRAPIVVRFPDEVNQSRGTTEKFTIFFATAKL